MSPRRSAAPPPGRPRDPRVALGRAAEDAGAAHLMRLGYEILARNVRLAGAEIDLVARDGDCIVFVEVRSRSSRRFGGPLESVRFPKQARIARAASVFLARAGLSAQAARFDVVGVDWRDGEPIVTLVCGAFDSPS
jgi:putative endonuclease